MVNKDPYTCNECGHSVRVGSGRFADRVTSDAGHDPNQNIPYPHGEFLCKPCQDDIWGDDDE